MLNEFYKYIAQNTLNFFQGKVESIQVGERYCLKLDTEDMVKGVDGALRQLTRDNNIQGHYQYADVYETYTIRLSPDLEIVVASKMNGMTDDFLATLRNAELTENHFPILMITSSAIDTITSGTGDLSASGMPFHAESIIARIKKDIGDAQLSVFHTTLLEEELKRKQMDRYSDKSSLYEYADLLTVLGRGYLEYSDYPSFSLLPDPEGEALQDEKKIKIRLNENRELFSEIERVVKHGNIEDDIGKTYKKSFISHLQKSKQKEIPWYKDYSFDQVKKAQSKTEDTTPLQIENDDFFFYSGSAIEYIFDLNVDAFVRDDGDTKAKRRTKNILIYNKDQRPSATILIETNIPVKAKWIAEQVGCRVTASGKNITITLDSDGCVFARAKIKDVNSNATFTFKVCMVDIPPVYLENIQTCYLLNVAKSLKRSSIKVYGIDKELVINPGHKEQYRVLVTQDGIYDCSVDQTLYLGIGEEAVNPDTGCLDCVLKCGSVRIPIQVQDEVAVATELTGIGAFKRKHTERKSFEFRDGKILAGTKEYFARDKFRENLELEELIVKNGWVAAEKQIDGSYQEYPLVLPQEVRNAYNDLIRIYQEKRSVPSLFYYDADAISVAEKYIGAVQATFKSVQPGSTLSPQQSRILLLGCVLQRHDEVSIRMSPLQPLNILYQLRLQEEEGAGKVRDNLVEKLSPLYLLPYIRDTEKRLYQAIEQRHSPEWRYYAPIANQRFQGSRNFVAKLVCDKINQYKEHFSFLFNDIGNNQFCINLVNMGDCREVFLGLLRYYRNCLSDGMDPDDMMYFVVNIYADHKMHNVFSLLSDQIKLKTLVESELRKDEDIGEILLILTGKIKCYYRNPADEEYQYSHLTFYEMLSSEDTGVSRMDESTTGIALDGLTSGIPSVLNSDWYKTGFGMKYARRNQLTELAARYNALFRVAFSGSSYESSSCIFTEIEQGQEGRLGKIYRASNWVVFINPKVDLSFFQRTSGQGEELMIIHYSDQYTSASGYDDITVTQKSKHYNEIIYEQLKKKGVSAKPEDIDEIINLFNAVNGGWMLRLITAKKLTGAVDSYFSREKMSILSAIKLCMAYYAHPNIVWIPVSMEEMLRVSGGAGLSQKEGLLSAKNLGFDQRATSDDILLVGIEGPNDQIRIYLHPVEVKIGENGSAVITKAREQIQTTYEGFWNALWPNIGRNELERKLSRNFFIQLLIVCAEKMKLYKIYPDVHWDDVLDTYRENLLNEQYEFSTAMDQYIGKGSIVSFGTNVLNISGSLNDDICLLEFPEKLGASYMVLSAPQIEGELEEESSELPMQLRFCYVPEPVPGSTVVIPEQQQSSLDRENIEKNENMILPVEEKPVIPAIQYEDIPAEPENTDNNDLDQAKTNESEIGDSRIGMQILFGEDQVTGQPLYWFPNDTNLLFHTNTGIIGTMGTGKTQFTKSLITQIYREQRYNIGDDPLGILIFDYKGDYNESKEDFISATKARILKPYHLPFNPLALTKSRVFKPLLPIHTANAFKDTLSKVYNLGPKQQNTLFQCIIDAYKAKEIISGNPSTWDHTPPTFNMVYSIYSDNEDIKKNDTLAAAMDKLYQFEVFEGDPQRTESLFDLLNGVVVIDLSGYDADIQSLIVAITLDLFYSQMQAAGSSKLNQQYRQLTKLILVDEADNFMSEGFPALKRIMKEGREFGVGTILSTQFLKHFGTGEDDYSKYILTWVVHNVADLKNADVEFVFKTEPKSQEGQILYSDIKGLKKHHSIVKIGNDKPTYIKDKAFWELYSEITD